MSRIPFHIHVSAFLVVFVSAAIYMVGGLETEDGRVLLIIVLVGGLISTFRAAYSRNKTNKAQQK